MSRSLRSFETSPAEKDGTSKAAKKGGWKSADPRIASLFDPV
jgi:hypothetical protein